MLREKPRKSSVDSVFPQDAHRHAVYGYMPLLHFLAALEGYCTSTPFQQAGVIWPALIWKAIGEMLSANCANGYNVSGSGVPSATCSAGGSAPGSGIWILHQGNCTRNALQFFSPPRFFYCYLCYLLAPFSLHSLVSY